jgi:hypothetical protein
MIYLYTENFFLLPRLKNHAKKILGAGTRGPQAVVASLERGLNELKIDFEINKVLPKSPAAVGILNGRQTLRWALRQKQQGKITRIVAGPNIVVTPFDYNNLILDPNLDTYLVPAQWSKDWWSSLAPQFGNKIKLWPAGVKDRGVLKNPNGFCLVYRKFVSDELYEIIIQTLKQYGISYKTVTYGKFYYSDFLEALKRSRFMLYLSPLESQGLALHDAWMADVPTLVYNSGVMHYQKYTWEAPNLSAPYLTSACGSFFIGKAEFKAALLEFLKREKDFTPRQYSLENFTDRICAKHYLDLIK